MADLLQESDDIILLNNQFEENSFIKSQSQLKLESCNYSFSLQK